MSVTGDIADEQTPLTITPLAASSVDGGGYRELPHAAWEEDEGPAVPWSWAASDDIQEIDEADELPEDLPGDPRERVRFLTVSETYGGNRPPPRMPRGPRPAGGGYATRDGQVVAFRSGAPMPLGSVHRLRELYESVAGLVAVPFRESAVLLRWDGSREPLGDDGAVRVSEDGRLVAILETFGSISRPRNRLRVIDLVDGATSVMPWTDRDPLRLVAVQGGTVHLSAGEEHDQHLTWRPGQQPRPIGPAVDAVDPLSGTTIRWTWRRGAHVQRPGGEPAWFELGDEPRLAPGGDRLWTTRSDPPAVTLFPVPGTAADGRVCWLPAAASDGVAATVWEDATHALVPLTGWDGDDESRIVRLDTTTGLLESAWEDREPGEEPQPWAGAVLAVPYLVRGTART